MHYHRGAAGPHSRGLKGSWRGRGLCQFVRIAECVRGLDFNIIREGNDAFDERARSIQEPRSQTRFGVECADLCRKQAGHIPHDGIVLAQGFNAKGFDNCVVVGSLHGARNGLDRVGHDLLGDVARQNAIFPMLPFHHPVSHRLAAIPDAQRGSGNLTDPQKFLPQFLLRYFVIDLFLDPIDSKDAGVGFGVFGDNSVVGLDLRLPAVRKCGGSRENPWMDTITIAARTSKTAKAR